MNPDVAGINMRGWRPIDRDDMEQRLESYNLHNALCAKCEPGKPCDESDYTWRRISFKAAQARKRVGQ